ncbi:MAG: amino acid permease, partial [Gammaproteobacteria bacterium]|nr:amino acid permease [Gammaproteobacteria bacterium]
VLTVLGVMAMFSVIPPAQINLINGVIQAFSDFFAEFHMPWFVPILAFLIAFGGISSLSAWIVGPARGLREMLLDHKLYPKLTKINQGDMPYLLLIVEGVVATILASVFLWMPDLQSAFWLLIALTSQFTVLVYLFLFASVIKLRSERGYASNANAFTIPGGKPILYGMAGLALLVSVLAFIFGLFPLSETSQHYTRDYVFMMLSGDALIIALPFILFKKLRG